MSIILAVAAIVILCYVCYEVGYFMGFTDAEDRFWDKEGVTLHGEGKKKGYSTRAY